jgi:hypothetical protein
LDSGHVHGFYSLGIGDINNAQPVARIERKRNPGL